jgi:GDP-L-fucose synthase
MSKTKILVTGGSGMVGKSLQEEVTKESKLNCDWLFVNSQKCDLTDVQKCNELFSDFKPNIVIHLASRVGGLYDNLKNNYSFFMTNILINTNVVKCCELYGVKKLISCLSTCIYGDNLEISTENIHDIPPHPSNRGYAYSKRFLDISTELLSQKCGIQCINIIPANLYGIYDNFNPEKSHVVAALLLRIYNATKTNEESVEILGSGLAQRQFVNSFDLAHVILMLIENPNLIKDNFKRLIVSGNIEIKIHELVDTITQITGYKGKIIYNLEYPDGQMRKYAPNDPLLQNFEFTPLKKGLEQVIHSFIQKS